MASARQLPFPWRLLLLWCIPPLLIAVGTVSYRLTEGWSWFESFYMGVVTLTSLGYADKHAVSAAGHVVTIVLALVGISTIALAATELLRTIITGELQSFVEDWRMGRQIDALDQHTIVCGYGHVGQHVCADLLRAGIPVVVIDQSADALAAARDAGAHTLLGDAAVDDSLAQAGVARARALVAVVRSDSDNVLITIAAHLLCPKLAIVSRAEDDATIPKLRRAGATRTVSPHAIAGEHIAEAVLHPFVVDAHLELDEQLVPPGSPLDGRTVNQLRSLRSHVLVAIKRHDGHMVFNPQDDDPIAAGDVLITLSHHAETDRPGAMALPH
jgi:voltage-gated potassium channel